MRNIPLKIGIAGCGTAGPAAAILLRRQGHEVTVFERAPECRAVGAGFLLQPSGMGVLEQIGILEDVLKHAAKVDCLHVLNADSSTLLKLHYKELKAGLFGAGLHRPVLLHYLMREMSVCGAELLWDHEITHLSRHEMKWSVTTSTGLTYHDYDLIILADGARSKLRQQIRTGGVDRGYPWGAHWFIGENHGVFPPNELYQVVDGTRRLGGFLATGRDLDFGEPLVSLFWSIRLDDDTSLRSRPLDEWKSEIYRLCPKSAELLSQIHDWSQVMTARYGDVRMRRWHDQGIIALGDAGHAMSPQLGQGVNLALVDAACLSECLASQPLSSALKLYQRRRRIALGYYQLATRWLTPWFQSDHEWLTPFRKFFFSASSRIPPARKLMTMSMAGLVAHQPYRGAKKLPNG